MAERFERSIQEWYQNSRTANLEYLNLEINDPELSDLGNNIAVIHDRLLLLSKVSIKYQYQVTDLLSRQADLVERRLLKLEANQGQILNSLRVLEEEVLSRKPLTKKEVLALVHEIASQPQKVEQEVLQISARIEAQQENLLQTILNLRKSLVD